MIFDELVPPQLFQKAIATISSIRNWEEASVYRHSQGKERKIIDRNSRNSLICYPTGAAWNEIKCFLQTEIGPKLESNYGIPLRGLTDLQLLRYEVGGHFLAHRDRGGPFPNALFTVIGGIVEAEAGGELLIFEPIEQAYKARPGQLIIFPSEALHASAAVTTGTKIVFVAWFLG